MHLHVLQKYLFLHTQVIDWISLIPLLLPDYMLSLLRAAHYVWFLIGILCFILSSEKGIIANTKIQ